MKKRPGIAIIIVAVVALLVLVGVVAIPLLLVGQYLGGNLDKPTGQVGAVYASSECVSPLYPPVKDEAKFAEAINKYIATTVTTSPFIGLGKDFVSAGKRYGINPAWVVNIARKESSLGIAIPSGSNNAYGRTATSEQPHVTVRGRLWYKYDSFQASIMIQTEYLKRRYIDQGLVTLEAITNVYAPPSENNTGQYINQMKEWIGKVMSLAGTAVTCPIDGQDSKKSASVGAKWIG